MFPADKKKLREGTNLNNTYKRERRLGLIGNGIIIIGCSEVFKGPGGEGKNRNKN